MDQFNLTNMNEPSDNQNQPTPAVVTPLKCRFEKADYEMESWFDKRADRWEKETAIHSAPGPKYLHNDYMAVITKGIENPTGMIPLILKRLSVRGGDWFFALEQITEENPAKECEDYDDALRRWNEWARQHGMIKEGDAVSRA